MIRLVLSFVIGFLLAWFILVPAHAEWHPGDGGERFQGHEGWHGGYTHENPYGAPDALGTVLGGILGGYLWRQFNPPPEPPVPEIVPGTPAWYAYCANKYKSFAPDGTYLGYDGQRHPCS